MDVKYGTNPFTRGIGEVCTTTDGAKDKAATWEKKKTDPLEELKEENLTKISTS